MNLTYNVTSMLSQYRQFFKQSSWSRSLYSLWGSNKHLEQSHIWKSSSDRKSGQQPLHNTSKVFDIFYFHYYYYYYYYYYQSATSFGRSLIPLLSPSTKSSLKLPRKWQDILLGKCWNILERKIRETRQPLITSQTYGKTFLREDVQRI